MLLAIDCGNTQIVSGVFEGDRLVVSWRLATDPHRTEDEYAVIFSGLFNHSGFGFKQIHRAVLCSVVPAVVAALTRFLEKYLSCPPLIVDYRTKHCPPVQTDNPSEVGADRIVNAAAGFKLYGGPLIIVDFGTATTFDCISKEGAYLGGAISPGIETACEALFARASRLSAVPIYKPAAAIGKNTADSLRSGVVFGACAQVDGIAERLLRELPGAYVIATGGLADRVAPYSDTIKKVDADLTLRGLQIISDLNRPE